MNMKTLMGSLLLGCALPAVADQAPLENVAANAAPAENTATAPRQAARAISPTEEIAGYVTPQDSNNAYCNIPVPAAGTGLTRRYEFSADGSPCKDLMNKARSITFENLPSATEILLTDSNSCKTTGESETIGKFWIKLRTTKKVSTPGTMQMSYAFAHPNNTVILPGMLLVDKYLKGDSTDALDALSCVTITTSRATLPKPVEPITFTDLRYERVHELDSKIECTGNRVLLGRGHKGDAYTSTEYLCGTPMQGNREVQLKNQKKSPSLHGHTHEYVCPMNTLMTGRDGDSTRETFYWCAEAWLGDERLEVLTHDFWYGGFDEFDHKFSCSGPEEVLAGMSLYSDENTKVWFRCARLFQLSPP